MSVQASPVVRDSVPTLAPLQPDQAADVSFNARWAAWIERGRQHDRAVNRKLRFASLAAAILGLLVAVFFGLTAGAL